jgi:hypothetical protein
MKTTWFLPKTRTGRSSLRREQAKARELSRFDFQLAIDLIGAELRRLRLEQELTIDQVAKALKMRKYRLCQIEYGMYIHFDIPQIRRLAAHYGVSHLEVLDVIPGTMFGNLKY